MMDLKKYRITVFLLVGCVAFVWLLWFFFPSTELVVLHRDRRKPAETDKILNPPNNQQLVFDERIRKMKDVCTRRELFRNPIYKGRKQLIYFYSEEHNFAYCKVNKAGCTFWIQLFLVLAGHSINDTVQSKRSKIHALSRQFRIKPDMVWEKQPPMILVSRNPYSRLFSAYIDKIFIGLMPSLRRMIRGKTEDCSFDISFEEFLRYVLHIAKHNGTLDRHFAPINSLCMPCDVNQYRIVKQETFSKDVQYILDELHISSRDSLKFKAISDILHDHKIEATIPGYVETAYTMNAKQKDVLSCMGWSRFARRMWRASQIQGYIKTSEKFPKQRFNLANHKELSNMIILSAKGNPLSPYESRKQRQEALVSAYKDVSPETVQDIKELYRLDFDLYGYEDNPPGFKAN